ncbi:tho complex subunit [Grosmannia clavigera kw1407]|uniref:Tho complex subunit n=1 Tax=Grosmannia clavigera (strain kw1407 / UAMH 11150) TaxID=655863 RepID=F0XH29_GROCL|nr:tho complex subunit [Grosmannia clavigera kw1407]EFX02685.1 tho complex subunit [Grosmannia clavigera kw1407]
MPALNVNSHGIPAVETFYIYLQQLLDHAEAVKPTTEIEPAISKSDLDGVYEQIEIILDFPQNDPKTRKNAIVETATRDVFGGLIAARSIDSPGFVRVWNLFDILSILADDGHCDPALLFWLIEELLDSQTIAGCRKVFDYLESRRERITTNSFNSKKLVILRSCNDLLRRLSRAEDTPFCGRVFIFLFQVFPLGDKSSVNLRGEYHIENVTTYDVDAAKETEGGDKMDVDGAMDGSKPATDPKNIDFEVLYPVFWSLQTSFSQPKTLFEPAQFAQFKSGLEASLAAFQKINNERRPHSTRHTDDVRRGTKRKRDKEDELADTYNPKYLTSRDLFQLETSDLTFRRHFLLQALIIVEFLLSLSPSAKKKLATASTPNKSVTYSDHVLSEEDTVWVTKMKHHITEHIRNSDDDGAYFFRMVDTILARDKNWVRWKVESCQSIERPGVSAEEFVSAKDGAQKAFARHRRRNNMSMGSFSLDFLNDDEDEADALEKLKQPKRFALPEIDQSKMLAEERKASKTWRALRIARQCKLAVFDKIDDDKNISVVYADDTEEDAGDGIAGGEAASAEGEPVNKDSLPEDTRPLVLVSLADASAESLSKLLLERNPGVFGVVRLFRGWVGFIMYGTQKALVDAVKDTGKVPTGFDALRSVESLEEQLKESGQSESDEGAKTILEKLSGGSDASGLFDKVLTDDGPESTVKVLESYIYGLEEELQDNDGKASSDDAAATAAAEVAETVNGESTEGKDEDATMVDADQPPAPASEENGSKEGAK